MIPSIYQEVEYLYINGNPYSTIDFALQNGDSISIDFLVPGAAASGEAAMLGAEIGTGKAELYTQTATVYFWGSFTGSDFSYTRDTKYTAVITVDASLNGFYVGRYQPERYPFTGNIYGITVTRNNSPVCRLIPCYRKADNVAGWYDDINSIFYTNDGSGSYTAGPDVTPEYYYTINYNSAGGSGSMDPQTVELDTYDYLTACSFTKAGYMFTGWATSSGGSVVYLDGAQIYNLAGADETITLYAVWEREQQRLILQTNRSENNRAVKDLTDIASINFVLKEKTSITDPVFILQRNLADIIDANYLTVPSFKRSYFITDIQSVRNGIVEISAHVDVLSSYIDQLKECSAIIHRQENKWNLYLDDGFFKTYQNPNIVVKKFPNGFTTQSFVLAVAGN